MSRVPVPLMSEPKSSLAAAVRALSPAARDAYLCRLLAHEKRKREREVDGDRLPNQSWVDRFGGRPREFIGELFPDWNGPDWVAWRAFVAAFFGEPLTDDELAIWRRCTVPEGSAPIEPPSGFVREAWIPVGRRGGKSRTLALIAVYLAICCDWRQYLAPGERGYIVVLAEQRKQAAAIMGYVKGALADPRLQGYVQRSLSEALELTGNVVVEVVTATISAVRSRTVLCALCDEIAFWPADETSANPDVEILNALRPAMATIPEGRLIAASSPYARKGALWDAYHRYFGKAEGPLVWQADTRTMHPGVPQSFLDEEYEKDPTAAAAEYGALFRADVMAFVPREAVEAVVVGGRRELAPVQGVEYHAFTDPSGGSADSFTLAVAHIGQDGRAVLDMVRENQPPFSPEKVVDAYAAELGRFGITEVTGDHYAGEWPREQFRKRGISYEISELPKSDIYREALPLITAEKSELLDHPRLIHQVCSLERKTSRAGRDSIDHPPKAHDDVANSALGALVLAAGRRYPALWRPDHIPVVEIGFGAAA